MFRGVLILYYASMSGITPREALSFLGKVVFFGCAVLLSRGCSPGRTAWDNILAQMVSLTSALGFIVVMLSLIVRVFDKVRRRTPVRDEPARDDRQGY